MQNIQPLHICGIGALGGFGTGIDSLLESVRKEIIPHVETKRQAKENISIESQPMHADVSGLERFISKRDLRRINHYSRMTLLGAFLALEDSGKKKIDHERTGLIIATAHGAANSTFSFLDSVIDSGDKYASPTHFANSVHNSAAAHVSMHLELTGPSLTVSQFEMPVASALITAQVWLNQGRVDEVFFGAVDEYCPVYEYIRFRMRNTFRKSSAYCTTVPKDEATGEGAVFLLLSREENELISYPDIVDVKLGKAGNELSGLHVNDLLILQKDQDSSSEFFENKLMYRQLTTSFKQLYGHMPIGQAIDVAIAAHLIRQGEITFSPEECKQSGTIVSSPHKMFFSKITSLAINAGGEYGLVSMARS